MLRTGLAIVLALLALLAIVATSLLIADRTGTALDAAAQLDRLRQAANDLLVAIDEAESGQRGFVITGRQSYLAPYTAAVQRIPPLLKVLDTEMAASRAPMSLDGLHEALALKLAELERTVGFVQAGDGDAATALVNTDSGQRSMTRVRADIERIGLWADQRFDQEVAAVARLRRLVIGADAAGLLVILLMAGLLAAAVREYLASRKRAAAAMEMANTRLRSANDLLDSQVRLRTADLVAANEEIQRFAYIVSHDLRSPLVNIMGFTSELEQAAAVVRAHVGPEAPREVLGAANDDIPEALRFIRASTAKMDRLINAILRLSRDGRRVLTPEPLDMRALVQSILDAQEQQVRKATVELGALPAIRADRVAVEQVFSNVIDNALKYLRQDRPGLIRIVGRTESGVAVFEVEDNGRGIAARDYERVFELFRRAGDQSVPGEGIGLAHVRALVRRLGGGIECRSEVGLGTTFTIRLPVESAARETTS